MALSRLAKLLYLDVSGTRVADLTPLAGLTSLRSLDCSITQIADLTPLANLGNLQDLNFLGTQVVDLTPLASLANLHDLAFSGTKVIDLAPLAQLANLASLDCGRTQVADLTPLAELSSLERLVCCQTEVGDLAPLAKLSKLQSISFWETQVVDITPLTELSNLEFVAFFKTGIMDLSPLAGLSKLQHLYCQQTKIVDLAPLAGLASLTSLDCRATGVFDLTPLAGLDGLRSLNCSDSSVTDLAPLVGLAELRSLDFVETEIADLSPLAGLKMLVRLSCSETQVVDLGPLAGLANLKALNCRKSRVADLMPLAELASLETIDCSGTQIGDLAPLADLQELHRVSANQCALVRVPRELISSPVLRELYLCDTQVAGVPSEVLSQAILDNCLDRLRHHVHDLEEGSEEIQDAKLLVLGNGRVGKTQICRRLRGEVYDESLQSTHGVQVTTTPLPGTRVGERAVELHIWDFGGQDIYHGTHALFLRTRAIFLIVWTPESETRGCHEHEGLLFRDFPLPHWLDYVKHLGRRGSPVILLQSKCDRPELECPILPIGERFLAFDFRRAGCYSARNDRGRAGLDESLKLAVEYLREHEGVALVGAGRMRVLRKLEAWREADLVRPPSDREHRTLTLEEFQSVCNEAGGVTSAASLLDYLHNSGVVFYRGGLFGNRIILDQSWALDAVYSVFERKESYRQIRHMHGRFTRSFLGATVWREYNESDQDLFLSLMKSCDVCFQHRRSDPKHDIEAEYIAPDLLPDRSEVDGELAGRWTGDAVVEHIYDFPFLSQAVIRSAISAIGRLAGESAVYWKNGVWGYEVKTGARTIVELRMQDERQGSISVACQGARRSELLSRIRELLEPLPSFGEALRGVERNDERRRDDIFDKLPSRELVGERGDTEVCFAELPPDLLGKQEPEIFISYAWGDDTEEGRLREKIVDDLCRAIARPDVKIIRDKYAQGAGDRISPFMQRLSRGDLIIAVISDKYLRSPYCMFELFHIFRHCGDDPNRFLDKVIPLILEDASISGVRERLKYVRHWKTEKEVLQAEIEDLGPGYVDEESYAQFKLIQDFAEKVGKILTFLNDKLMPRDFERMASEGFQELLPLLRIGARDA